ncbi:lysine-specific demethylase JMJ25-like [Cucurbita pepo subsp. pepo]|uniref:lysine-specific demethylase JMJ25-like n=1 Tax=Cucurbita pepo subsp. pepo TaxID=3664 RepID=UPI000C9D468A|nr:lysine-specific demethylase JMJ25-like [Cucurbita pepo subsp. pepo]
MEEEEEGLPDHLRCKRTDGKQWRCKRRVKDNLKLCEIHHLQGRHRQYKEKVPDSLKLQRTCRKSIETDSNVENLVIRAPKAATLAKLMKRKKLAGTSAALDGMLTRMKKKKGSVQVELIRMVLRREVEKRGKKKVVHKARKRLKNQGNGIESEENSDKEMTRQLPYGLMAISPSPSPLQSGNEGSSCGIKVGAQSRPIQQRRFRSKNVNILPVGELQVLPNGRNVGNLRKSRRKKCHWCQESSSWSLIQCSSCQKTFFCIDCIRDRYFDTQEEVKKACPVCRGICHCKDCSMYQSLHTECKDSLGDGIGKILRFHYLICVLLPILKQINIEMHAELETEAMVKGIELSEVDIKQDEFGSLEHCCSNCKTVIADLYRSCPSCSYNLCLSCCHNIFLEDSNGVHNLPLSEYLDGKTTFLSDKTKLLKNKKLNPSPWLPSSKSLHKGRVQNSVQHFSCPSKECVSCSDSLLELRCIFPLSWTKELEVNAEEIVCSYDFPESVDSSSNCTLCFGEDHKVDELEEFQKVAVREDSNDNYLYYPSLFRIRLDDLDHFQRHWIRGHPVIVRNVLETSDLTWDPVVMFRTYLERIISRYENGTSLSEASNNLDWCEVEIGIRQYFMGSLKGKTHTNTCNNMLKLKGCLSSHLFQEKFPAHYAEIMRILPLQEYMNPMSGLLNLATKLPQGAGKPDMGPCVYMAYGCSQEHVLTDSVSRLCYDSYDVINILAHSTDVPVSTEQLTEVVNLLQRQRAQSESSNTSTNQSSVEEEESCTAGEETPFIKRFAKVPCFSASAEQVFAQGIKRPSMISDGACDSDPEPLMLQCKSSRTNEMPGAPNTLRQQTHSALNDGNSTSKSCGAQWDVFRRQDVPMLSEYLRRHSDEFIHKHVVHPILDQSCFLDATHKLRLKEEFQIEPWTFEQNVGEAVIIPAGCPYQIRNGKSCVHVVLDFMSPESVGQSIQLIDEVRLLPKNHIAKEKTLEVKKRALETIDAAIKKVRELTNALQEVPH